jgi:signal peptidase II
LREPGFLQGHVVDFFMLPNFPVFNVADICINIAAATIVLQAIRGVNLDGTRHDDADRRPRTGEGTRP